MRFPPIACPGCDSLVRIDPDAGGGSAECPRCGTVLCRPGRHSLDVTLALVLTALTLFLAAQFYPLLRLRLHGGSQEATLLACVGQLTQLGWPWLAAVVLVTVALAPCAYLGGLAFVLVMLRLGHARPRLARVFRVVQEIQACAMLEVFLLGILVAYVKLANLAVVVPGRSLYALAGSMLLLAWATDAMDHRALWQAMGDPP